MRTVFAELQRGRILWERSEIHSEEVGRELTVDVMQLVLVPVAIRIRLVYLPEVAEIIRTPGIDAFMDDEMFSVFLARQGVGAVRTFQGEGSGETVLIRREGSSTDLAQELTGFAVVAVAIRLWSTAGRAGAVLRDITPSPATDRRNGFSVLPGVIVVELLPIPGLVMVDDLRKLIDLELLIFGGMGIVECPLFERDIFADELNKLAVLLIKLMAELNKIKYNVHKH